MALRLVDLLGTFGWAVVVKGFAVHSLAPGEDTAAAVCGLCGPSALTELWPRVVLDGTVLNPSYYQEKAMRIL